MILLSILIPTLPERGHHLDNLIYLLKHQLTDQVEVLIDDRPRGVTTGEKRNDLYAKAKGMYSVSIDDDDWIPTDYVKRVLVAASHNADCITYKGFMTTNGASRVNFVLRLGEKYEERGGVYYRFPNHIVPIKTDICKQVKFQNITMGEDYKWAKEINDKGLIKTEYFIDYEMYHYQYRTNK